MLSVAYQLSIHVVLFYRTRCSGEAYQLPSALCAAKTHGVAKDRRPVYDYLPRRNERDHKRLLKNGVRRYHIAGFVRAAADVLPTFGFFVQASH